MDDEGFGKGWLVDTVAFLVALAAHRSGTGFWSSVGMITLAVILGLISAWSLMLLAIFNLPVNVLTVILVMLAANALTLLITAAVTPFHFGGFGDVIGTSFAIVVVGGFVREMIDRFSGD